MLGWAGTLNVEKDTKMAREKVSRDPNKENSYQELGRQERKKFLNLVTSRHDDNKGEAKKWGGSAVISWWFRKLGSGCTV